MDRFLGERASAGSRTLRQSEAARLCQAHCRAKPVATKDAAELRSVAYEVFGHRKHKLAPLKIPFPLFDCYQTPLFGELSAWYWSSKRSGSAGCGRA